MDISWKDVIGFLTAVVGLLTAVSVYRSKNPSSQPTGRAEDVRVRAFRSESAGKTTRVVGSLFPIVGISLEFIFFILLIFVAISTGSRSYYYAALATLIVAVGLLFVYRRASRAIS